MILLKISSQLHKILCRVLKKKLRRQEEQFPDRASRWSQQISTLLEGMLNPQQLLGQSLLLPLLIEN